MRKITIKARLKRGVGLAAKMPFSKITVHILRCVEPAQAWEGLIKTCRALEVRTFLIWQPLSLLLNCSFARCCRCSHPMPSGFCPVMMLARWGTYRTGIHLRMSYHVQRDVRCWVSHRVRFFHTASYQPSLPNQYNIFELNFCRYGLACDDYCKRRQKTKHEVFHNHPITFTLSTVRKSY